MKDVEFVQGHTIENAFDFLLIHEVTGDIEHGAAPGKAGLVLNINARGGPSYAGGGSRRKDLGRKELEEGLHPVKKTGLRGCAKDDRARRDRECVAFGAAR